MTTSTQQTTQITTVISGDYRIDTLLEDSSFRWNNTNPLQTPVTVDFSFMQAAPTYADEVDSKGFTTFSDEQKSATRDILNQISLHFNISFREVNDTTSSYGQIRFGNNNQGEVSDGYAFSPDSSAGENAGDLYINNQTAANLTEITPGSRAYSTLVHEIGHTLGLKHPGNYNAGEASSEAPGNFLINTEDNLAHTTMSYVEVAHEQQPTFYGKYDFLALEYLYGRKAVNTGDDTHQYDDTAAQKLQVINDSSGTDTIDASSTTVAASIDLRDGSFSSIGKMTDGSSASNNLAITYGTVIENAVGTAESDTLIGNASNNTLTGGAGNDTLDGGEGIDIAIFLGGHAHSTITKTANGYTVTGADGTDMHANIERFQFSDSKVALDLDGNAGTTAKILGAVFGSDAVANKAYAGIGLSYLDNGMSYNDLMQLAIDAQLGAGASHSSVVNLLYTNVVGSAPDSAALDTYTGWLDAGTYTVAELGVFAADTTNNTDHINLVGLVNTGLEYIV